MVGLSKSLILPILSKSASLILKGLLYLLKRLLLRIALFMLVLFLANQVFRLFH